MFSILSMATLVLATSIDAAAYTKSGKALVKTGRNGIDVSVNCDLSMSTCFTDGKSWNTEFKSGETYRVYDGYPGGRDYVLYSSEHEGETQEDTPTGGIYDAVLVDGGIGH